MDSEFPIRVFPRRTSATPDDQNARVGLPTFWDHPNHVYVSVAFSCDKKYAEWLATQWNLVCNDVQIGGPAYNARGGEFTPGLFVKKGYVITSRGCPNKCWFCQAWKNEGNVVRELEIKDGYNLLDNNILACSDSHISRVFDMLERQKEKPRLTGGLEAKRLKSWHVERLQKMKPEIMWFAYDTPDDWEPLLYASKMLDEAGMIGRSNNIGCYVLIGHKKDTLKEADERCKNVARLGFFPQAMLFNRGDFWDEEKKKQWASLQREWANKYIVGSKLKKIRAGL